jgi:hypothetical protein
MALTLFEFRNDLHLVQNQFHRRDAENAKADFSSDPIGPSPRRSGFGRAGGRRRLDQKLPPFGIKIEPFKWLWQI